MVKHVKANLIPRLGLQIARANIDVSFASNNQVVPEDIVVANLSVGTWALDAKFVIIWSMIFVVILGMEFLYNSEVHLLSHLLCI